MVKAEVKVEVEVEAEGRRSPPRLRSGRAHLMGEGPTEPYGPPPHLMGDGYQHRTKYLLLPPQGSTILAPIKELHKA